jgi:phosphoenolpyruvate-protein phosphotransferase (PTS system enzyme I)
VKFEGVAASPGIGIGPLVRFEREELAVRDTPVPPERHDDELRRFDAARDQSRRDLERIRDGIAAELGERDAAIYDTHLMLLDDPELRAAVERGIRTEGRNAGWVFRAVMSSMAARFERVEDEYLRERLADVLDVERRVLRHLLGGGAGAFTALERPSVLVAHDLGPSEVALLDRRHLLGLVTEIGSRTSHSAIVARGRGIPAVVAVRGVMQHARSGQTIAVDGFQGVVELDPDAATTGVFEGRRARVQAESRALEAMHGEPAQTTDGRAIELGANMERPGDVDQVLGSGADGVGLFRTEFFYLGRLELPTEEEQYAAYREVAERLAPRPVIFRTMDLGGDKVASYLGVTHETNPFLGWRGIRFALAHPEVFRAQLRAIYRASAHGRVRLMFPMVSSRDELLEATAMCTEVAKELKRKGVAFDPALPIGLMIETPSAVWMADALARDAAFLSIGTNDLTQYTLAMDRDNERIAALYEPLDPSVLRSIRHTIEAGHAASRWVGVCGEMAGDPRVAVLLLGLGIDELSMSCFDLPRVKAAIRSVSFEDARSLAGEVMAETSARGVKAVLRRRLDPLLPPFLVSPREVEV